MEPPCASISPVRHDWLDDRLKMTVLIRRSGLVGASLGAVERALNPLGPSGVRRDKMTRTTITARAVSQPLTCSAATSPPPP